MLWLMSEELDMATGVQILDKSFSPQLLQPRLDSQGEGKLLLKIDLLSIPWGW